MGVCRLSRGGRSAQLLQGLYEGRFSVVTSEPALAEVGEVVERPDLINTGSARMIARVLLAALREIAEAAPITGVLKVCRDPNDDIMIETAIARVADVWVSEDKDLTTDPTISAVLAQAGVRVLKQAEFLDELAGDR